MAQKSPMSVVLQSYGKAPEKDADRTAKRQAKDEAKRALVAKLADVLEHPETEEKEAFKERLFFVSNSKLLKLLDTQERLKKEFGSKANLVEAILAKSNRSKDEGYRTSLASLSIGRLLTLAPRGEKKKAAPAQAASKAASAKAAAEKKAAAKKAEAPKAKTRTKKK